MKVLAILQNQWYRDPDRVRALLNGKTPQFRRAFLARTLFAGCRTGKVLLDVFGRERCARIVWEEASPEIGGISASVFPPDPAHIAAAIEVVKPEVVMAFGLVAKQGVTGLFNPDRLIVGPHPTARGADILPRLRVMARALDDMEIPA